MTFWLARNYCKLGCACWALQQPQEPVEAGACVMGCGSSRTSVPPASPGERGPSARWALPLEQHLCYGAECTAVVPVLGDGGRDSPVPTVPGWVRTWLCGRSGSSGLGGCAGSGALARSGRSRLDSCSVSVACLSFHGVSILQPPSVLIPGGKRRGGRVYPGTAWLAQGSKRRRACLNFTCSNSSSNICWLIKGRLP